MQTREDTAQKLSHPKDANNFADSEKTFYIEQKQQALIRVGVQNYFGRMLDLLLVQLSWAF